MPRRKNASSATTVRRAAAAARVRYMSWVEGEAVLKSYTIDELEQMPPDRLLAMMDSATNPFDKSALGILAGEPFTVSTETASREVLTALGVHARPLRRFRITDKVKETPV